MESYKALDAVLLGQRGGRASVSCRVSWDGRMCARMRDTCADLLGYLSSLQGRCAAAVRTFVKLSWAALPLV